MSDADGPASWGGTFHVKQRKEPPLLPDAELREDLAKHIIDIEPAREAAERVGGFSQMLGGDLRVLAGAGAGKELIERASRALDLLPMPGACDERGLSAAEAFFRKTDELCFERIKPFACLGRDQETFFRRA
jgi:hypothetical protein